MRVENLRRNTFGQPSLGQYGALRGGTVTAEAAFKVINEEGSHSFSAGKAFPYTISKVISASGRPVYIAPVKGAARSEETVPGVLANLTVVRIPLSVPAAQDPDGNGTFTATVSLYGMYGGVTYPIFENRQLRFTASGTSPLTLDLATIYSAYASKVSSDAEEAYAREMEAKWNAEADAAQKASLAEQARAAQEAADAAAADAAKKAAAAEEAVQVAIGADKTQKLIILGTVAAVSLAVLGFFWISD
jgi:hypothetical protein